MAKMSTRLTREERETSAFFAAMKSGIVPLVGDPCAACKGSGECKECYGSGRVRCECTCGHEHDVRCVECDETGDCGACSTPAEEDCVAVVGAHPADSWTLRKLRAM